MSILLSRLIELIECSYNNITSAKTTQVKAGSGFLKSITVNKTAAGTVTVYNNAWNAGDPSGAIIATLKANIVEGTYHYGVKFQQGLTIVTGAASDITVAYK